MAPKRRSAAMPDLATIDEAGVRGYDAGTWWALFGPANLPRGVVNTIHEAVVKVMSDTGLRARLAQQQGAETTLLGPDELLAHLRAEARRAGLDHSEARTAHGVGILETPGFINPHVLPDQSRACGKRVHLAACSRARLRNHAAVGRGIQVLRCNVSQRGPYPVGDLLWRLDVFLAEVDYADQ